MNPETHDCATQGHRIINRECLVCEKSEAEIVREAVSTVPAQSAPRKTVMDPCTHCGAKPGHTCDRYNYDHPSHPKEKGTESAQSAPTPRGDGKVNVSDFASNGTAYKPIPPTSAPTESADYVRGWNAALRNAENVLWDEGWLGDSVTRIRALAKESK